jgi:hypothetical protein
MAVRSGNPVASMNLAVKFLLELFALALLAYWGVATGDGFVGIVLAVVAPALMIAIWGVFAAPRAARRLPAAARIPLELGLFAVACAAGFASGATVAATVFAMLLVLNGVGLTALHQWSS